MMTPEDKYARRVFLHLDVILFGISEKAAMVIGASTSEAFRQEVSDSSRAFMHHVSHPDTDLDTVDIHGWPWPAPEDYLAETFPLVLDVIEEAPEPQEPMPDPRDAELDALRARIAELEAAPILELSNEPPAEALMEAYPDEDHAALKARILAEFASLRNMLVGHIPMTMEQLARLQALEHPRFQTWLQA